MTTSDDLRAAKGLTKGMRVALERASDDAGGVAGSEWYFSSSLGGKAAVAALNRRHLLRMKTPVAAGGLYAITDAGRRAIAAAETTP